MKKALLRALLEPTAVMCKLEAAGDYTARLALLGKSRNRCRGRRSGKCIRQRHDTPTGSEWLESVRAYEKAILQLVWVTLPDAARAPYPAYRSATVVGLIRRDSVASGIDCRMRHERLIRLWVVHLTTPNLQEHRTCKTLPSPGLSRE
ncbi:L-rhamnose isomerase [Escherichia coli]